MIIIIHSYRAHWVKKRSFRSESIVNRWSAFFCNAFIMKSLATTEISLGNENSHWIKGWVHSLYFSLSICGLCGKMELFRPTFRRRGRRLPKYRQSCHKIIPKGFRGIRNPKFHSRCFSFLDCMLPSRNRKACWLPSLKQRYMRNHNIFRLYVPVQNIMRMKIAKGLANLLQLRAGFILTKLLSQLYTLVKRPFLHILH